MRLRFRDVERERHLELKETIPIADLPLATPDRPVLLDPVPLSLTADFANGVALISVEAEARLTVLCARCLEPFPTTVKPVFEFDAGPEKDEIEVVDEVRQHILLALPTQPLCSAACRGLCPVCGANRNANPCRCAVEGKISSFDVLKNFKIQ